MTRMKLVMLAVLATCMVGAVASASASAHEFKLEGKAMAVGTKLEGTTAGTYTLLGTIIGLKAKIVCKEVVAKAVTTGAATATAEIEFLKCEETAPEKCPAKVALVGAAGELVGTSALAETEPALKLTGTGGKAGEEIFTTITPETGCSVKTALTVKGKQFCELPNATKEAESHEVVCKEKGSELKMAGSAASFEGPAVSLAVVKAAKEPTKAKWSAI